MTLTRRDFSKLCLSLLVTLLFRSGNAETDNVKISHIEPHEGSTSGAVRITIYGGAFAFSEFNHGEGNEHLGNRVDLVSLLRSYPCEIHKDGTTEKQIMCITPARMVEDSYYVKVSVDGEAVPQENHCGKWRDNNCRIVINLKYTPTISHIYPPSGPPDSTIIVKGRLFSDRRGSHVPESSNGKTEKFLRAYMGGSQCELPVRSDDDKLFEVQLDSTDSNDGYYKCSIISSYVGNQNASFIIEGKYGRSRIDLSQLRVSQKNIIYSFQSYGEINAVSPASSSTKGGNTVTITGRNFDDTNSPLQIFVGGELCDIKSHSDTEVVCVTPPQPDTQPIYPGNRGIDVELWEDGAGFLLDDIPELTNPAKSDHQEDFSLDLVVETDFAVRVRTFFVPPSDNNYYFKMTSDTSSSKLFLSSTHLAANKSQIISGSRTSEKIELHADDVLYMELIGEGSSNSSVEVSVCVDDTNITSGMTGASRSERQRVSVRSTVRKEIQMVALDGITSWSGIAEVKTIDVQGTESVLDGATFRLGLGELFTVPFAGDADSDVIQSAILSTPGLLDNSVTVTQASISGGTRYTITFSADLGDIPDLTIKTHPNERGEELTVTTATSTQGQPSFKYFSLSMDGIPTAPLKTDASADEVEKAVLDLFSAKCPRSIENPTDSAYSESFESTSSHRVIQTEELKSTEIVSAFCGKYFYKNPFVLYSAPDEALGIYLSRYKTLCFAYRGGARRLLYLGVNYKDNQFESKSSGYWLTVDELEESDSWRYVCLDMMSLISTRLTAVYRTGASQIYLSKVYIAKEAEKDLFVDDIYIGINPTTEDITGLNEGWTKRRQALPSGHVINAVSVTKDAQSFTIDMTPRECGHDFELFEVSGAGSAQSGSSSRSSLSAVYGLGSGTVTITSVEEASPPVTGQFDITFINKTKTVPVSLTSTEMQDVLNSIGATGTVVSRGDNCANFDWTVTWLAKGGNQPSIEVADKTLAGIDASISVSVLEDGRLCYSPIPAEFLRTVHDKPQAMAFINDIPTACTGSCDIEWLESATPTVSAVSPSSGTLSQGTSITITGTRFSTSSADNTVIIGGVACNVSASTETSITCAVGNGPLGVYDVEVTVAALGLAEQPDPTVTFEYVADVDSISPSTGSIQGGTDLSISGYGFQPNASVTVGGNPCAVTSNTPSQIVCVTPASDSLTNNPVDVVVTQNGNDLTSKTFTYDPAVTATITSVSPSSTGVQGDIEITVAGTGFGASKLSDDAFMIGNVAVEITSYSDTEVKGQVKGQEPGSYPIRLKTSSVGYADTRQNNIADFLHILEVTNVYPSEGSLFGGTIVTITGQGFSLTPEDNIITFGDHVCEVSSSTDTQVVCQIGDTATVHQVTNQGQHPVYGTGYVWDRPSLTVELNDIVRWRWTSDSTLGLRYNPQRTSNLTDLEYDNTGFSAGAQGTANGVYEYRFTEPGVHTYWSGRLFDDPDSEMTLRGYIEVVERPSHIGYLNFVLKGFTAAYNTNSGVADPTGGACPGTTTSISGCTTPKPTATDNTRFSFAFWDCSSPVAFDISPTQASVSTDIVITGEGFTSTACQNEVNIAGFKLDTSSSSSDQITAAFGAGQEIAVGKAHPLQLRIGNLGFAMIFPAKDLDRMFVPLPFISALTPTSGSTKGGTAVTISGGGFSNPEVMFGVYACEITSSTYTEIVCVTGASSSDVDVTITSYTSDGTAVPTECEIGGGCTFQFSSSVTPTVTAVSPSTITAANTQLTLTGSGFGIDSANVFISVSYGNGTCSVDSITNIQITCTLQDVVAGAQTLSLVVTGKGKADIASSASTISVEPTLANVSPSSGGIYGGTRLTISGNGFLDAPETAVLVDASPCSIESITTSTIVCLTPPHAEASVDISVTSDSTTFTPSLSYNYVTAGSPVVTSVSPAMGKTGDPITISGSDFTSSPTVSIDGVACSVASTGPLTCTLGTHGAGTYPVVVHVAGVGNSNSDIMFDYSIAVSSATPSSGSFGGGQNIEISGAGFDPDISTVTLCGEVCPLVSGAAHSPSLLTCRTPPNSGSGGGNLPCDIVVAVNNVNKTLSDGFTYDVSQTPMITSISPTRGGTGGGTTLTIAGSGFSGVQAENSVSIAGVDCEVTLATSSQIECTTGQSDSTVESLVIVEVVGSGLAQNADGMFYYVDVWSSPYTWGGLSPPGDGGFVVIGKGQTILLDTDTAILKFLLIQGGSLIFEDKDVKLDAEMILVTDGGLFQVGTEEQPFQNKAIITLHGHLRSKELPIYGIKGLAVREGTLDLHGQPISVTWTLLAATANAGDTTIQLKEAVDWAPESQIVIATTSDRHSQRENEVRIIDSVSGDGLTITLTEALQHTHLGVSETFAGQELDFRAEVGLLSRNVIVRGSVDTQWQDDIKACEAGFDTGEFSTQTCFQGRFGDEVGSNQFGSQIIMHAAEPDKDLVVGRLEYIEVTNAGQAFRLGRYPVHFHLMGIVTKSYVRGLGIHQTFNRAVNVHGTHNLVVEDTVAYNVMGGAFFLEDGIETGITFQRNLAVFVKASTSLLNDDITPAAFWLTNPNNTVLNNHAVGGTHFGFWYRMHDHPDGPSFDANICPKKVPLGTFAGNTVHSQGWFGIWIFESYFPMEGGGCDSTKPTKAVFDSLTVWNCEKGAETVNGGSIQFTNLIAVNNEKAGYEGKLILQAEEFSPDGPMLADSLIVARTNSLTTDMGATDGGLILPYREGMTVKGVTFVNFDQAGSHAVRLTRIDGTCSVYCGGFAYHFSQIVKDNSPNVGYFAWAAEGLLIDEDGTLSGVAGGRVLPTVNTLPTNRCSSLPSFSPSHPASVCQPDVNFVRFSFNKIHPESLRYKAACITNSFGKDCSIPYTDKRITHKEGWSTLLVSGEHNALEFEDADHIGNISYDALFDVHSDTDYVVMAQRLLYEPDRFSYVPKDFINQTDAAELTFDGNTHGDWKFQSNTNQFEYLVSGNGSSSRATIYRKMNVDAYRCYYENCEPPPDPNSIPPSNRRPEDAVKWSDTETWKDTPEGYGGNYGNGSYGLPENDTDVLIPEGMWVVADVALPRMKKLLIYGTLELDGDFDSSIGGYRDFTLLAEYIYIVGGRLIVGWPDSPFKGNAEIILRGSHDSERLDVIGGPEVGSKAIGVFGGLDLHGMDSGTTWVRLGATASLGDITLQLTSAVNWAAGDEVIVTPTGYDPEECETFSLVSVDGSVLTLNDSIKYRHTVFSETINSQTYSLSAEVGRITRNVKVIGEDYPKLYEESYGARILVGFAATLESSYSGFFRASNVEFYHTGQEGYIEPYDPRHSVSFLDTGAVSDVRPSYIRKCAFHNGFSTAIGVYSTSGLEVKDNVIHNTVGISVDVRGDNILLENNLVTRSIFPGTYQDRLEKKNIDVMGAIDATHATNLRLIGNVVSGAERAAYRLPGEPCDSPGKWTSNVARSSLHGVAAFPDDKVIPGCLKISNFTAAMCLDFGIYINTPSSAVFSGLTLVNNMLGIFSMVIGPSAVGHVIGDKFVEISDSLIVGTSDSFNCIGDVMPSGAYFTSFMAGRRSNVFGNQGKAGITLPVFTEAKNNAPTKPLMNIMAYPAIAGKTTVQGVTFAHFGNKCGRKDVAIATNPSNDDANHAMETQDLVFVDTPIDNRAFIHRPNLGKINPSDCVDMDCDGLKKAMIKDLDGSLLGSGPGTSGVVLPDSAFEWGGDPSRGLGDYRIPKTLLTDLDGKRKEVPQFKGIYLDRSCVFEADWQAHRCANSATNYEMLIIESMDADTEMRRLSPVAVKVEDYVDLINGPQDHGWCAGYTCQERLSTFMALVPTGKEASIYFTSTSPQNIRLILLNAAADKAVLLSIFYSEPWRRDIYIDGELILPTNGEFDGNGGYELKPPANLQTYKPKFDQPSGTNYIDLDTNLLYVLVKGDKAVNIVMVPVIVVVFQASAEMLTADQFFGENLVNNLVAFLGIDPSQIRIANIVGEDSARRRKRRSLPGFTDFYIEIGNAPVARVNETVPDGLTPDQLKNHTLSLVTAGLFGQLEHLLYVVEPQPDPSDPEWQQWVVQQETGVPSLVPIQPVDRLYVHTEPQASSEGKVFATSPVVQVLEITGSRARFLGTKTNPWLVSVTLGTTADSYPGATLDGNTTLTFVDGWANFTSLSISHAGKYVLEFAVVYPPEAANFTAEATIDIPKRPLVAQVTSKDATVVEEEAVEVVLELRDALTAEEIDDLGWRGHNWSVVAELSNPEFYLGEMYGNNSENFDRITRKVTFSDLRFSKLGEYHVRFVVRSTPPEYEFYVVTKIHVLSPQQANITVEKTARVEVKFDVSYSSLITSEEDRVYFGAYVMNHFQQKYPQVILNNSEVREGSILVSFTISGSEQDVVQILSSACGEVDEKTTTFTFGGQSVTLDAYFKVDGVQNYGTQCGAVIKKPTDKHHRGLEPGIIAAIVVVSVLLFSFVVLVIAWRIKASYKHKSVDTFSNGVAVKQVKSGSGDMPPSYTEQRFESLKSINQPPSDTTYPSSASVRPATSRSVFPSDRSESSGNSSRPLTSRSIGIDSPRPSESSRSRASSRLASISN